MELAPSDRKKANTIRISTPDSDDGQIWLQSTIAGTHRLTRGLKDDFSFFETDLLLVTNRGGGRATCRLEGFSAPQGAIYIGSNRRACFPLREGEARTIIMRPGEVLSVRSIRAEEPGQRHADGSPVLIRQGQISPS
jgi:hypothetical protein